MLHLSTSARTESDLERYSNQHRSCQPRRALTTYENARGDRVLTPPNYRKRKKGNKCIFYARGHEGDAAHRYMEHPDGRGVLGKTALYIRLYMAGSGEYAAMRAAHPPKGSDELKEAIACAQAAARRAMEAMDLVSMSEDDALWELAPLFRDALVAAQERALAEPVAVAQPRDADEGLAIELHAAELQQAAAALEVAGRSHGAGSSSDPLGCGGGSGAGSAPHQLPAGTEAAAGAALNDPLIGPAADSPLPQEVIEHAEGQSLPSSVYKADAIATLQKRFGKRAQEKRFYLDASRPLLLPASAHAFQAGDAEGLFESLGSLQRRASASLLEAHRSFIRAEDWSMGRATIRSRQIQAVVTANRACRDAG